jgi:hypothetical protein
MLYMVEVGMTIAGSCEMNRGMKLGPQNSAQIVFETCSLCTNIESQNPTQCDLENSCVKCMSIYANASPANPRQGYQPYHTKLLVLRNTSCKLMMPVLLLKSTILIERAVNIV